MKLLEQLDAIITAIETFEAPNNSVAYVRRQLIESLDTAHELVRVLRDDGLLAEMDSKASERSQLRDLVLRKVAAMKITEEIPEEARNTGEDIETLDGIIVLARQATAEATDATP